MPEAISEALMTLLQTVSIAVITALGVIIVQGVNLAKEWATVKINGLADAQLRDAVTDAVNKLDAIVCAVVTSIEQEEKQEILKALEDGNVTRDELVGLKDVAVARVKQQMLPDTLDLLEESFGDLTSYISDKVSQQVFTLKQLN